MSLKGDLYFANVEENDSRSDYCCFAAFPRLRTIVQKMPMTLKVSRCKSVAGLFLAFCFSFLAPQATVNADVCPMYLMRFPLKKRRATVLIPALLTLF